jgi:hypothetical protein
MKVSALNLDPSTYRPHALHTGDRAWVETNCYVDLWIEVVHALSFDPTAALAFTVAMDFEGDQWLFFKHPTADLYELYGIDVQELAIWRPLLEHATVQVRQGRIVLVEVDSFFLPDTRGVSYRQTHTKTTIGIESIDSDARTLTYFHNAGFFKLDGDDFGALFRPDAIRAPEELAPYTEFAKLERLRRLDDADLARRSVALLSRYVERVPKENPFSRFGACFRRDLEALVGQPPEAFHNYAFTTLRQCGSCFELCASYMSWLEARGETGLGPLAAEFEAISNAAKALQLKAARAVLVKRPIEVEATLASMTRAWDSAVEQLKARYAG